MNRVTRVEPGPEQVSVWDFPRPPALEAVAERLRVVFGGELIADTNAGWQVLETSHPPVYYFPPEDVRREFLVETRGLSFCEFKGSAVYWDLRVNDRVSRGAAWSYPEPTPSFRRIRDYLAFYASRVDECWVGADRVQAQAGDFYGGWITQRVVGPFKGAPGTSGW